MINLIFRQELQESSIRNTLLTTVLDLYNIPYNIVSYIDDINGDAVITDSFVEEIPGRDSNFCQKIIDKCASRSIPILFYYPSECESTLSSSYYPTRDYVAGRIPIGLVKQGTRTVDGFHEYCLDKYFIYRATNQFNRARLAYTFDKINTESKLYKFLFLNGTLRPNRVRIFDDLKNSGLLESSIHSFVDYRIPEEHRPVSVRPALDWPWPALDKDFRFETFYPPHFSTTEFTLAVETTDAEVFVTEKIYKSLLVGHPFIAIAGARVLEFLNRSGFKTFDPVIDESYDLVANSYERYDCVLAEVTRLVRSDIKIIDQTYNIRLHNRLNMYKLSEEVYWDLRNIIVNFFPQYADCDYINLPNLNLDMYKQYQL